MAEDKSEVRKKEFLFRGQPIDSLKSLDVREFAKYLNSRQRRTILRNFEKVQSFVSRCEKKLAKNKKLRTHLRDIIIVPKMIGYKISVHNGKNFFDFEILPEMIGHTLGEFAMTRQRVNHGEAGIGATKGSRALKK